MLVGAANALKVDDLSRRHEQNSNSSLRHSDDDGSDKSDGAYSDSENADRFAALRMKRFSRRDSNMFGTNTCNSPPAVRSGDTNGFPKPRVPTYAMSKRRSLLPTIPTLPEIEQ